MRTLNSSQAQRGKEMHLCAMQLDICNRVIAQLSMPGETVLDPFAGIFSVPHCAILNGRKAIGIELSPGYFADGVMYCKAAEAKLATPTLFDMLADEPEAMEADRPQAD
jgi:DNA modification methylase